MFHTQKLDLPTYDISHQRNDYVNFEMQSSFFLSNSKIRRNWQVPLEQKVNNLFIAHFCRITNEVTPILILNEMHRVASAYYQITISKQSDLPNLEINLPSKILQRQQRHHQCKFQSVGRWECQSYKFKSFLEIMIIITLIHLKFFSFVKAR